MIQGLFLDIGGVLLTNGWDYSLRKKTAETFGFDVHEAESRHQLIFELFETGRVTLDEYLKRVIFFETRPFTLQDVKQFIFEAARPFAEMIAFVKEIKEQYHLKVAAVSNESRELAIDRIHRFDLASLIDFFVISSFVYCRKPDPKIYHMSIDMLQVPPTQIAYIDDRLLLVEIGKGLGLQGIHHKNLASTQANLALLLDRAVVTR
jgi:putative hydrolase of the HAD superfamily